MFCYPQVVGSLRSQRREDCEFLAPTRDGIGRGQALARRALLAEFRLVSVLRANRVLLNPLPVGRVRGLGQSLVLLFDDRVQLDESGCQRDVKSQ